MKDRMITTWIICAIWAVSQTGTGGRKQLTTSYLKPYIIEKSWSVLDGYNLIGWSDADLEQRSGLVSEDDPGYSITFLSPGSPGAGICKRWIDTFHDLGHRWHASENTLDIILPCSR